MSRPIGKGDRVTIHMNDDASLDRCCFDGGAWIIWTVTHTPSDVGDSWYFERDGQAIAINPNSANFDGVELVAHLVECKEAAP